ncbi:hypothetical protein DA717_14140 [Piscirickettsiaceae bacterium NZ-RLO2]|nr:hypothetical protein DA717_14140 [Piscirickettsiaceae bacterium NZ-RLO2]
MQQLRQQQLARYFPFFLKPTFSKCIGQFQTPHHFTEEIPIYRHELIKGIITNNKDILFKPLSSWNIYPLTLEHSHFDSMLNTLSFSIKLNNHMQYKWQNLPIYIHTPNEISNSFLLRQQLIQSLNNNVEFISQGEVIATHPVTIQPYHFNGGHPIERIKDYLNFPELSNFINIYFNQLPTFEIDRIKINIKLNQQNKNNISSTLSQAFYINTIPFTNTSSEHALPIDVQGFRETYPIIHPNIQGKFQLSAIKKTYYKEHGKTIDLLPKHLTADNLPSYELIQQFTGKGYSELRFHFSENLIQPRTVFIDADWFQLDHFHISDLKLSFYNRSEDYFKIKPISSQPTILSNERLKVAELIELANIKNHRIIKYDDLKLIISS